MLTEHVHSQPLASVRAAEGSDMAATLTNWAGNHPFSTGRLHRPRSVDEIHDIVRRSLRVKVLGTRHSFNDIADTTGDLISLEKLDRIVSLDGESRHASVTIEGGMTCGRLGEQLHAAGFALHNLASLPHISVAGACSTATHGSGDQNRNLATAVSKMEIVTAAGDTAVFSRNSGPGLLEGAAVSLGGIGVIVRLTLDIVPAFDIAQEVYEDLPLTALRQHFNAITSSAYSVSLFTDWRSELVNQVWLKHRVVEAEHGKLNLGALGARPADRDLHPIKAISPRTCTPQLRVAGPAHERLPHFRMNYLPSSGEELQSEYLIPREYAIDAIMAIHTIRDRISPLLQISEIRTIARDDLWMSPCYQQSCVGIHFTWKKDWPAVRALLPEIEQVLAPFKARPHWGKLFTLSARELHSLYPRVADFQQLLLNHDPQGKFRNAFLDRYVLSQPAG